MPKEKVLLLSSTNSDDWYLGILLKLEHLNDSSQYEHMPNSNLICLVIDEPHALLSLGKQTASTESGLVATDARKALDSENGDIPIETAAIQMLRIELLDSISPGDLTATKLNGGVDGPTMFSLLQAWREAYRGLPELHSIERVQFDLSCQERLELRQIVRFLQEISTVMYMKAKRNMGRELAFEVTGCDEKKKEWLEKSFPGAKVV
jgi:hypothetical protein